MSHIGRLALSSALTLALVVGCGPEASAPPLDEPLVGAHVYVAGSGDGRVHVFDAERLEEVASIAVGAGASEVHATPDGRTLWALATDAAQVALIDAATLEARIIPVGARPVHSYLEPSGRRIWVGNDGSADVSIIELETGAETRTLTGNGHHKIAFVTDEAGALAFAYVSNITDGTLTVLDPDGAALHTIEVGPAPHGIAYSRATRRIYSCSGDADNSIEVIDPFGEAPHTIVDRIALPGRCGWLHAEADGRTAWAGLSRVGQLARVDLEAGTFETWDAGPSPDQAAIVGDRAFVANVTEPQVTVIDLDRGAANRTIAVGAARVVDGSGHRGVRHFASRVYVPNEADGTLSVIDAEREVVIATLTGIPGVKGIAVANGGVGTPPE